jgi:hypothetical protein
MFSLLAAAVAAARYTVAAEALVDTTTRQTYIYLPAHLRLPWALVALVHKAQRVIHRAAWEVLAADQVSPILSWLSVAAAVAQIPLALDM